MRWELHPSAHKHGVTSSAIAHAVRHPWAIADLDHDSQTPKLLIVGPDRAGNLLEIIALRLHDGALLVIHAMSLRRQFLHLLDHVE